MSKKAQQLKFLMDCGIIGIVRVDSSGDLIKVVEAIKDGGIKVIEVTMTTPNAIEVIREASAKFGDDILLGVGSVLDPESARAAILSGAEFVVCPTLNKDVIKLCNRYAKIVVPGTASPTEVLTAWEEGADMVKVFPAGLLGGPAYIKAVKAPLPQVSLVPAGGVSVENAADYFKAGVDAIAVSSPFRIKEVLAEGNFDRLTETAGKLVDVVKEVRGVTN